MLTVDASVWVAAEDPAEPYFHESHQFLTEAMIRGFTLHQPFLSVVEVSATIARKTRDTALGMRAGEKVLTLFGLVLHPLGRNACLDSAQLATRLFLRSADAIYVATAVRAGTAPVTLDMQLRQRAAAVVQAYTPAEWLTVNP